MAIVRMKKVQIFALRNDLDRISKIIQDLSIMEITGFSESSETADDSAPRSLDAVQSQNDECDRKLAEIGRALGFLEQIAPVKPNLVQQFAGIKTYLTQSQYRNLLNQEEQLTRLLSELQNIENDLGRIQTERNKLQTLTDNFKPWTGLKLPYSALKGSGRIHLFLGSVQSIPAETIAEQIPVPCYVETISKTDTEQLFILFFERENYGTVQSILSQNNIVPINLPPYDKSVSKRIQELQNEIDKLNGEESKLKEKVIKINKERPLFQAFYDFYLSEKARLESVHQFLLSSRSLGITGWVAEGKLARLENELRNHNITFVLNPVEPEEGEEAPTAMQNNAVVTPFEYLVQSFSLPQYHEIDPSSVIAPFFFIFFGISLGDAGYGLILALICAGLLLKLKMGPIGRKISWMFLISGIGAIIFGIITGSVMSLQNIKIGIFNPLEQPILLLLIALGLGVIQLFLGLILSAYTTIKEGHWADAVWNQGTLMFFLATALVVIAKDAVGLSVYTNQLVYLFLIAGLSMVIANTRGKKGIGGLIGGILGGFYNIYGTIGFFSDILSYSRLMALGLSGGVMGGIMNQLAGMLIGSIPVLGWILGAAVFLFGHALNLALSVLGAYVHSSRLQYLEFFGKFFEGGGKPFTPLQNKQKYTFLINEREA